MTEHQEQLRTLILDAIAAGALRKLSFSCPKSKDGSKIKGVLTQNNGRTFLSLETQRPQGKVSHCNLPVGERALSDALAELLPCYLQIHCMTSAATAEYKCSKHGNEVLLGERALRAGWEKMSPPPLPVTAMNRQKRYILSGDEPFLHTLGITDATGRIHDKKQGKFRQIHHFLEHVAQIYSFLPKEGTLLVYDLCCGKSYLSFALYHYLHTIKGREVSMLGMDLKKDVIGFCNDTANALGYTGMRFLCQDVRSTPQDVRPDLVVSLHACDIATDIVLNHAMALRARVILSTPCCHRYLNDKIQTPELRFVTRHGQIRNKLCEALTEGLRLLRLESCGYEVMALELTDPDNTPKNTLLRAVLREQCSDAELASKRRAYEDALQFVLGEQAPRYLEEIQ